MAATFRSARHQRLAELLAEYRQRAGLHQADVARQLGRHQPFIANIESGQRRVDVTEFLQLAKAIGFDPHTALAALIAIDENDNITT
ncbi:helix-turn-helix domain-containing protein [Bosea sp. Root483D1]|uniref:helix-turn-helix domain-containing protein n=1 Tax=Bosea sp. Root483D1 TaxID=1736544 RepID=UPI0009E733EC|nr:helix-turn-helix transcriptional regulator [Bosea sp. Root483D1]